MTIMHTTLYWCKEVTLLFESWKTDSWLSYLLALLFCFFLSLFHQLLEARRLRLRLELKKPISSGSLSDRSGSSVNAPLISPKTRWVRVASPVLFGVNSAVGYLIMLVIMSCNGGVFVAVVLGLSIAYFLFSSSYFGDADDVPVAIESNECSCS